MQLFLQSDIAMESWVPCDVTVFPENLEEIFFHLIQY